MLTYLPDKLECTNLPDFVIIWDFLFLPQLIVPFTSFVFSFMPSFSLCWSWKLSGGRFDSGDVKVGPLKLIHFAKKKKKKSNQIKSNPVACLWCMAFMLFSLFLKIHWECGSGQLLCNWLLDYIKPYQKAGQKCFLLFLVCRHHAVVFDSRSGLIGRTDGSDTRSVEFT